MLIELRGKSVPYSCFKKKEMEKREKELINKIETLEANLSEDNIIELETIKKLI